MSDSSTIFQFGVFEFDIGRQELRKRGRPLRLPISQIRLLMLFLEQPRGLVSRQAITKRLWDEPGLVDVEGGINTAVNRLRTNLGDDPVSPKYIATVVGLGYKFIADVKALEPSRITVITPTTPTEPLSDALAGQPAKLDEAAPPASRSWRLPLLIALGIVVLLGAVGASLRRHSVSSADKQPQIPQLSEQVVTTYSDGTKVTIGAISPDGQMIAYSNGSSVFILWPATHTQKLVDAPGQFEVQRIDWSPNQQQLVASGIDKVQRQSQAWTLSLMGQPPQLLLNDASLATVSRDGHRIAFLRNKGHEAWTANSDGRQPQRLQEVPSPESFEFLLWSPDGRWLLLEHLRPNNDPSSSTPDRNPGSPTDYLDTTKRWERDLIDARSGRIADRQQGQRLESGYMLKDGRLFYTSAVKDGSLSLMAQRIDLSRGRFAGEPAIVGNSTASNVSNLSGSADGRRFAIIETRKSSAVTVATLSWPGPVLDNVRQITYGSLESYPHAWTPAGDAVLLENSNSPSSTIYEQKTDGSTLKLIAQLPTDAAMGEFTPDGRSILFLGFPKSFTRPYGVFRVPATGGTPEQLNTPGIIDEFHCSLSPAGRCILRESLGTTAYVYYTLDPLKGLGEELARIPWQPSVLGDWSISPNGRVVAVANHDPLHPGIQLVDLHQAPAGITEIPLEGFGVILEPTWAPDGRGLYIETQTEGGYALLYYSLTGHTTLLRESNAPLWAVPARDGKKLAYPDIEQNTNLWVGTMHP